MMSENVNVSDIKDLLEKGKSCLVVFGQNITLDQVAASLSLFLAIKTINKDVYIASPSEMRVEYSRLIGVDKVSQTLGNKNLVISFGNYNIASIEKISHNEGANNRFELVIQPKSGNKSPDPGQIEYFYRGLDAEVIFLVGVNRLEELGDFYEAEKTAFSKATRVAFSKRQNSDFAEINIVDSSASSYSEMVYEFIDKAGLSLDSDIASNLIAGIDFATNRFQNPNISPSAFSVTGKLLSIGGKRQAPVISSAAQVSPMNPSVKPFIPFAPVSEANPLPQNPQSPPQDWLQPKIYKGTSGG